MAKATASTPATVSSPATDPQVEAQKQLLAKFAAITPPLLATGGDLSTLFSQDLATVSNIRLSKDGKAWNTIFSTEKDAKVTKMHPAQYRAVVYTALAFLASARSDRGFAYITWAASNKAFLEQNLGKYTIEVTTPKSTLTKVVGKIDQMLVGIDAKAKILLDSVKAYPPVKGVGTRHADKNEEYEIVF